MQIVVTAFTSLDGVVQAPGGPDEDRDGGFAHGGWSMRHFDPEVMGSPSVARALADADLVDEYRLMIEPVILGGGKSIFPTSGGAHDLRLVESTVAATGTLVCTYRRA